jgi:predicted nucleotidyltransferase
MSSTQAAQGLASLPEATHGPLQALTEALEKAAGPNLAALVVYGSAVRGGYEPGQSDIDVIVVLHDTGLAQLRAISEPLLRARFSARVEAMVLKGDNIASAADVFPLLYDDVRQRHLVLSGADPFVDLEIEDTHRRLRIEQELREARIRMRRAVIDALGSEANIAGAVARKVKQVRGPLHALLLLKGLPSDDRLEAVLEATGKAYGIDTTPLLRVASVPEMAHTALRTVLDAAIQDVDRLELGAGR